MQSKKKRVLNSFTEPENERHSYSVISKSWRSIWQRSRSTPTESTSVENATVVLRLTRMQHS